METNIRQRGDVGGSAKTVGKRIKELEWIYGIGHGGDRYQDEKNSSCKKQSELASNMNMDVRTLQNYKLRADMVPELHELVDTGIVTKTTALAMMKNLSTDEQEQLISLLDLIVIRDNGNLAAQNCAVGTVTIVLFDLILLMKQQMK